jgi:hypothetical protein
VKAGAPFLSSAATVAFSAIATGTGARPLSVTNLSPSHQYAASIWCPPIIMTARSLAETATLRLAGHCAFIRSPSVGTRKCTADTTGLPDVLAGSFSSSAQ